MTNTPTKNQKIKESTFVVGLALLLGISVALGGFVATRPLNHGSQGVLGVSSVQAPIVLKVSAVHEYSVDSIDLNKRVSITLSITNNTGKILQISPGLQMQLLDENSRGYPVTAAYLPAGEIIGGPLASGKSWAASIDFSIPQTVTPTMLEYLPDGSANPILVRL
jgi:hypothetical protein